MWLNILIFYLVEPTQDAQIPSSSLWGVETDCISCVIEVNSYSLRDPIQQLLVWDAGIKPKIPADHLRIRKTHVNDHRTNSWLYVQRDDNSSASLLNKGTNYNFDLQTRKALSAQRCSICSSSFKTISQWKSPMQRFLWDHLICMWNWVKWNFTGVGFINIKLERSSKNIFKDENKGML